jgi:phosphoenolpyruvate synthase/pyruvate phosphate dikinase
LQAGKIAEMVDFCSFGTNDLTQTTMGISRDDASKFLNIYKDKGIINSYKDEDTEEMFFLTEKGKKVLKNDEKLK